MSRALAAEAPGPVAAARANVRRMVQGARGNLAEIRALLDAARARLRDRAAGASEADAVFSLAMLRSVDEEIRRLDAELRDPMRRSLVDALQQGDTDTLNAARNTLGPGRFAGLVGIDRVLLDFASADSADLVQQISQQLRARLNLTMRAASTGSVTTDQVAQQIGSVLVEAGRPEGVFGRIYTQVERIHRTETGKLYQHAIDVRQQRLQVDTGLKLRKRWVAQLGDPPTHRHAELNGVTVDVDELFDVPRWRTVKGIPIKIGTAPAVGPLDPALPADAAVNCMCTLVTVFPETD